MSWNEHNGGRSWEEHFEPNGYDMGKHRHEGGYYQPGQGGPQPFQNQNGPQQFGYQQQVDASIQKQIVLGFKSINFPEKTLFLISDIIEDEQWEDNKFLRYLRSQMEFDTTFVNIGQNHIYNLQPGYSSGKSIISVYISLEEHESYVEFWKSIRTMINQYGSITDHTWFFDKSDLEQYVTDHNYMLHTSIDNLKESITKRIRMAPTSTSNNGYQL